MGHYLNSASPNGDRLELLVYDTADPDTLPSSFDPADPNAEHSYALPDVDLDIDFAQIASIQFTIRADDNNFIDELRIGSSYASVLGIPEPAPLALALVGAAGLAVARARQR